MAASKVKISFPNLPDGEPVEVLYLGLFENGSTANVTEEAVANWVLHTGKDWPENGTLVLDHSESERQRKEALAALKDENPEAAKELQADIAQQQELLVTDEPKKGGK